MASDGRIKVLAAIALSLLATVAAADEPLSVRTVQVRSEEFSRRLWLTGEIAAPETLRAAFPTGGRITSIAVDDGDHVAAGVELARIDRVQQEQALRAAKAQLAAAEAEFVAASDNDARQSQLFERGATTRAARNAAGDRLAAAVAKRAQAEAERSQAEAALGDTVLLARAEGTVIRRLAEPGQVVGAAQPILELAQGKGFEAVFDVPEAVLTASPSQAPDPVIELSPLDRPGIVVSGHVREVSPLVDAATGTIEVKVAMNETLPGLSYGDAVRGATTRSDGQGIALPFSALTASAEGPAVWVVDPTSMTVAIRQIEVLRYTSEAILVGGGLAEGETVVSLGAQLLYPGRTVRILEGGQ